MLLRCVASGATLGGGRCRSRLVAASGRAAHMTRSEPCVGNAEGIAEEEWALELGIFPGLVVVLIFFGVFDASVAQASSEGWFGRVPDPSLRFYLFCTALCDDVSGWARGK